MRLAERIGSAVALLVLLRAWRDRRPERLYERGGSLTWAWAADTLADAKRHTGVLPPDPLKGWRWLRGWYYTPGSRDHDEHLRMWMEEARRYLETGVPMERGWLVVRSP